jgi:hypothetical protein
METKRTDFRLIDLGFDYTTRVVCEYLIDDHQGFRFALSGEGETRWVLISFDSTCAYRKVDEGDFLRTLMGLPINTKTFIYEALDSSFLDWYVQETLSIRTGERVRHFIFLSQNDCIEVLTEVMPVLKLVQPNSDH